MLDEVGLSGMGTRGLARRLGVEQPALYWHFPSKAALLEAMAAAAMRPHARRPLPEPTDDWRDWFVGNTRSFRDTLLRHRDGARLHAGSRPLAEEAGHIERKIGFLTTSGASEVDAVMAFLGASRFTLGCVLEEQADQEDHRTGRANHLDGSARPVPDHLAAFEAGLRFLVEGLASARGGATRS